MTASVGQRYWARASPERIIHDHVPSSLAAVLPRISRNCRLRTIVSIAAAGLPALGAALSGIRAQGDFEGFAQRSASTERELTEIEEQIHALMSDPTQIGPQTVGDMLLAATRVMAKDVSAWQQLYVSKRLTLPA